MLWCALWSRVKPPHHVKVAWHRGGPRHASVTRRSGFARNLRAKPLHAPGYPPLPPALRALLPPRGGERGGHGTAPGLADCAPQPRTRKRSSARGLPADLPTTLPRGLVGRLNRVQTRRRRTTAANPLATGFAVLQRLALRDATRLTKPARAVPKKQPDLARNSGARCLPTIPQNGGCGATPFPVSSHSFPFSRWEKESERERK